MHGGPRTFRRTPWAIFQCSGDCASGRARPPGPPASTHGVRCPVCGGACRQLRGSGAPPTRGRLLGGPALLFSQPSRGRVFDHRAAAERAESRERARRERANRLAHETALSARHEHRRTAA